MHRIIGFFLGATLAACVTPSRVVPVAAPTDDGLAKADLSQVTFILREFKINGEDSRNLGEDGQALRKGFVDHLTHRNQFARVIDSSVPPQEVGDLVLFADVNVDSNITVNRTYILDYLFWWSLGFIAPAWGDVRAEVELTMIDKNMLPLFQETESGINEYSLTFFGWFRAGPAEDALARAYETAFNSLSKKLSMSRLPILTALRGSPQPRAAVSVADLSTPEMKCGATGEAMPSLAVLPLQVKRIEDDLGSLMDELLVSNVSASRCFKVISSADINAMLGFERMKDAVSCSDASCVAEIGGALGVELMMTGTVGRLGDYLLLSLTVIDIAKAEAVERVTVKIPNDENTIPQNMSGAVQKLMARVVPDAAA